MTQIYYSQPWSTKKNIGAYYNKFMELLPDDDDFACFTDGDAMFMTVYYGRQIEDIVKKYPQCGLFTCMTNRVAFPNQIADISWQNNDIEKKESRDSNVHYNNTVGGSGLVIRGGVISHIPEDGWKMSGWVRYQQEHWELKKAFYSGVTIKLLDMKNGGGKRGDIDYYIETKHIRMLSYHKFNEQTHEYVWSRTYKQFAEDIKTDFDLITFDDGHKSQLKALDMLKECGIKGMVAITTGFLNSPNYMTDDDVRMIAKGHYIANHTHRHLDLTKLSDIEIGIELSTANDILYKLTGVKPKYVALPWNKINNTIRKIAAENGLIPLENRIDVANITKL